MAIFDWRADDIERDLDRAIPKSIDETMLDCVARVQSPYPTGVRRVTGFLANTYGIVERAQVRGNRIVGLWGNPTADYALPYEMKNGQARAAGDALYKTLADRIKEHMR